MKRCFGACGIFEKEPGEESKADLQKIYNNANLVSGDKVYTLCQTAVRATHTWFVLSELLGYANAAVYDGSWTEWGNRTDTPIDVK